MAETAQTPSGGVDLRIARPALAPRPEERRAEPPRAKEMLVGEQVHVKGTTSRCDLLSISGHVELTQAECEVLDIAPSGVFDGSAKVVRGEIRGTFRGKLQIKTLVVRSTATVDAELEYDELEVERGAKLSGSFRSAR